ncbi:hypothetical protein DC498_24590 [Terrimonas sp.]|uniref:tetratricopeptide repeat protein n=1 Tax=Terrimonas sp. TaxID=1914338 RepID=UPI000D50B96D|nr:hypothetical protein [Terrimonas sp.]PVD49507.1 hypothetical protein DC498_24590 [Terrimonas sp.]
MNIKQLFFSLFTTGISVVVLGQNPSPAEFYSLLKLNDQFYKSGMSDSMFNISQELLEKSISLKNDSFQTISYRIFGNYYFLKSDYTKAIEKYLAGIKIAENNSKIDHLLPQLYNNIGFNYSMLNYHDLAMEYLRKGELIGKEKENNRSLTYIYENIGLLYLSLEEPDSSLYYLSKSENSNYLFGKERNVTSKDTNYIRAAIYIDYAKSYTQLYLRDSSLRFLNKAKSYFETAIQFSQETEDNRHLASSFHEYGYLFFKLNLYDSCKKYATQSLQLSTNFKYIDLLIKNADLLQKTYKIENNLIKAYHYLQLKDSCSRMLSALDQNNQLLDLTFTEKLKDREIAQKQEEIKKLRHRNIEFSLIAIGLVTFVTIFLMLSRTFIVNQSFIKFVGQIGLLIVFEFINLLIHPTLESLTHHNSFLMLLILVIIAAILIPIHHKLEKYVRVQLVEKNKKIRESAARKILKESKKKIKHGND